MLLMDIEKEIQPLSRNDKLQLMQRLAAMLLKEETTPDAATPAERDAQNEFQPDPAKLRLLSAIAPRPYDSLYDADEAAQTFYELKRSGNAPVL